MERENRNVDLMQLYAGEQKRQKGDLCFDQDEAHKWKHLPDWKQKDLSAWQCSQDGQSVSDNRYHPKSSYNQGNQTGQENQANQENQTGQKTQANQKNQTGQENQANQENKTDQEDQTDQKDQTDQENQEDQADREDQRIREVGQVQLSDNPEHHNIHLLSIIGEIEGHDNLSGNAKTTKYEHILPKLAAIEDSSEIQGVLVILNTMGGDVEAGLAIAEMLSSLSKPTVSLVLGGSHSIGVPIAVSCDYSFIVPTGTMVIHPVRMNGMVIGVPQTFEYFKLIQDRITGFICRHSGIPKSRLEELMMETGFLTKDVGTILVGEEAVRQGIIDEVGGINTAMCKLHQMIKNNMMTSGKKNDILL